MRAARQAGARFSLIAENVAQGSNASGLHVQWMNSAAHRANLLDQELNSVGIAVMKNGSMYFAVEDFSVGVPQLSLSEQEAEVRSVPEGDRCVVCPCVFARKRYTHLMLSSFYSYAWRFTFRSNRQRGAIV